MFVAVIWHVRSHARWKRSCYEYSWTNLTFSMCATYYFTSSVPRFHNSCLAWYIRKLLAVNFGSKSICFSWEGIVTIQRTRLQMNVELPFKYYLLRSKQRSLGAFMIFINDVANDKYELEVGTSVYPTFPLVHESRIIRFQYFCIP